MGGSGLSDYSNIYFLPPISAISICMEKTKGKNVTNLEKENRHFNFTEEGKFAFTDIFQVTKQSCVDQFLLSVGREEQSFLGYIITGQMWKWFCPFTETTFAYLNNIFHALKWTEAVWRDFSLSFRFLFTFFVVLLFSMQLACSKT